MSRTLEQILVDFGKDILKASYRGEIGAGISTSQVEFVIEGLAQKHVADIKQSLSREGKKAEAETAPSGTDHPPSNPLKEKKTKLDATGPEADGGKGKVTTT